jgi:CcmD family protein
MTYMVAAYLIIWGASFVFIFSMVRRQANIQRELAALKELINEKPSRQ